MGRWQPGAGGRLGAAALALYAERGYEGVTVADIADRAGVTARTFFRHFTDKREVLFAGSDALGERLIAALDAAPPSDPPLDVVAHALEEVALLVGDDVQHSRTRQAVIVANAELQERELSKLASWSRALSEGLRRRGVGEPTASIVAETAVAVFRVAFDQWLAAPVGRSLVDTLRDGWAELRSVTGSS